MRRDELPLALVADESNPVRRRSNRNNNQDDECQCSDRNAVQETTNAFRLARVDFMRVLVNRYSIPCCKPGIVREFPVTNRGIILATFTLETPGLLFFRCSPFSRVKK